MLISTDSKYLFQSDTNRIKVQNIKSGEVLFHLNYDNKRIETICLNPLNKYQLLSFYSDCSICLWDFEDGILLKTYTIDLNVKKVITIEAKKSLYCLSADVDENYSFNRLDLNIKTDEFKVKCLIENIDINKEKLQLSLNYNAKFIAFIQARRKIIVYNLKTGQSVKLNSKHEITCLTIHPNEDCIASGTSTGKIILWHGFSGETNPTKTTLHWHALPVLSLCFTQEGSYLLSGGHECVLVKWMYKTGQKDFRPRLGSPINKIICSMDNMIYALDHVDNSSHIIGTNLSILQTFSGFIAPLDYSNQNNPFATGLAYFSRLNCLVTNGKPGHLQFFMQNQEKLLFNLDIIDENYISPENLQRPNIHTEIEHISFSSDNHWLATIERRDDLTTTPEIRLKFWQFDTSSNKFNLNTIVRYPHSFERINRIKFKPKENVLISTGSDMCFKSWILVDNIHQPDNTKDSKSWAYDTCNGYRNMNPKEIEFSLVDKNQAAVSFNHIVTLWDSEVSMDYITDLVHCDIDDHINQILYSSTGLIATHRNCINLWSLNYSCIWSMFLNVENISRHPFDSSTIIMIINEEGARKFNVGLLKTDDSNDRFKIINKEISFNINKGQKLNLICLKNNDDYIETPSSTAVEKNIDVFYCTNKMTLEKVSLDNECHSFNNSNVHLVTNKFHKNLPENNLKLLISQHKSQKFLDDQQKIIELTNMKSNLRKIDLTPAYLLPKVSSFCYDTLISMLEPIKNNRSNPIEEMDVDEVIMEKTKKNSVINGFKYQNMDDDDDEDENYYKLDKNNNNLNRINNDDKKSEINLTLQSFKFEDFLIKFSK